MIGQLPMMQLVIAENIPLSICFTQGAHQELLHRVCSRPVFQSMTWMLITRKLAMNYWVQLIPAV
jgi:hypothetical protein